MSPRETRTVLLVALAVFAGGAAGGIGLSRREDPPALAAAALGFDAERALATTRELVTRHPRRVLGSLEARQATGTLKRELEGAGYTVDFTHFDAVVAGRREAGRNLIAVRRGSSDESIVVVAHYDTAPTTLQGASDNGSGVGVLVELARLFGAAVPRRSLVFLLSDGEEWGMLGCRDFVAEWPGRARIVAALSLDGVAPGELEAADFAFVGQGRGYAPPWLRELARAAASAEGVEARVPSLAAERVERALSISWSDQGPFLAAGIPALNLGSRSRDHARQRALYHSSGDTIETLRPDSFRTYGRIAERIVRALDGLDPIPPGSMDAVRTASNRYLGAAGVRTLQFLAFLPLGLALVLQLRSHRARLGVHEVLRELFAYCGAALPLALGYVTVLLCSGSRIRLLPLYSLYPGTPKDPILERPYWGVLAAIAAVVVAAAALVHVLRRALLAAAGGSYEASRTTLVVVLALVAGAALVHNPYWAVVFLALPSFVWSIAGAEPGARPAARAAWAVAIVLSGAPWYVVIADVARTLGVGWKVFWYGVLAASTGFLQPVGVLLAIAAIAVGVRFLALQGRSD